MKKIYAPLSAATLLLAAGNIYADSDLKLYGKANVSLNQADYESTGEDEWQLNSNASRLGVKGYADINDNLKAIYKMEFEVFVDDGNDGKDNAFKQRNIFVGLEGNLGRIIAGKHDTPLKLAQGKIDRFNDLPNGDIKNILPGENRVDNIVMYTTPNMDGFTATAAIIPGEDSEDNGKDDSLADGKSMSLNFNNDTVTAAFAVEQDITSKIIDEKLEMDIIRAAVDVKLGIFKVGALYQTAEATVSGDDLDADSFVLSTEASVGADFILKAQYGMTEFDVSGDPELTQIALGVDKKLNKNTKLYAYYSTIESDSITIEVNGVDINDPEDATFGLGAEFKF